MTTLHGWFKTDTYIHISDIFCSCRLRVTSDSERSIDQYTIDYAYFGAQQHGSKVCREISFAFKTYFDYDFPIGQTVRRFQIVNASRWDEFVEKFAHYLYVSESTTKQSLFVKRLLIRKRARDQALVKLIPVIKTDILRIIKEFYCIKLCGGIIDYKI